jgi:uncharacterized protein YndB with AHSA1/START domain
MVAETHKIIREITIPAPLDQVWEFLMNEEKMKRWLDAKAFVIDVYEGGNIEIPLTFDGEDCFVEGEMALIVPHKKFEFTWIERNAFGETWFNNTMVRIELEPNEMDTKLTLRHDGFKYLPDDIQEAVYHKYRAFWGMDTVFERLQSLVLEG